MAIDRTDAHKSLEQMTALFTVVLAASAAREPLLMLISELQLRQGNVWLVQGHLTNEHRWKVTNTPFLRLHCGKR